MHHDGRGSVELSVIVPCYNEAGNVRPLVSMLDKALTGFCRWEIIFVDDNSPDGTAAQARLLARTETRVRVIRRIGRRGLSSAVIEGALSSSADFIAVMDGDLQHDEAALRPMLTFLRDGGDLVVASRYVEGGDHSGLDGRWRRLLSRGGGRIAQSFLAHRLTDPMSGFFALRRDVFEKAAPKLSGAGFKILLDLMLSLPAGVQMAEVPVIFRPRQTGESKLDTMVLLQFATMILERLTKGLVPIRFVSFALVGLGGVLVNVAVMNLARHMGLRFSWAQLIGTLAALIGNFLLNNRFTYYDRRLRGARMWSGFVVFVLACSVGAIANIGVARLLFDSSGTAHGHWDRSSAAGAVIGVVWNYAVSSTLVWR